ncbi:MAG: 50S ribosomal protein L25 [Planctomycetaceae bacterium]
MVDLKLDGNSETAAVSEVQWDTFRRYLIHADFMRVDANERVHVEVPVHLKGTAPGVVAGGILEQPLHTLSIECLAINIPKEILVKIGELEIGATIHVRELTDIPSGVTIQNDPDQVVLHIVEPRGDDEAGAGAVAGEPEVIGRPKADA